jgi:hypothetical protein
LIPRTKKRVGERRNTEEYNRQQTQSRMHRKNVLTIEIIKGDKCKRGK